MSTRFSVVKSFNGPSILMNTLQLVCWQNHVLRKKINVIVAVHVYFVKNSRFVDETIS